MAESFVQLTKTVDVNALSGAALVLCMKEVECVQAELDALKISLVRRAHEQNEAELDGLRSAAAWLEKYTGVPAQTSRERQRVGDRLRHLPIVTKWFDAGLIPYSKVRALTAVWSPDVADSMIRDEQWLVEQASKLTVREFVQVVRRWKISADPADSALDQAWRQRRAYLSATPEGLHHLHAVFDAENGAELGTVLDDISHELWLADQGAARAAGHLDVLDRSAAQRRADALIEMARRAATTPEGGRRPRPLVHLVVDYETYTHGVGAATLNHLTTIDPTTARRLSCDANIARVVSGPDSAIIELGEARNPNGPLRQLIWARDRTCVWPGCTIPAPQCAIHHIVPHHAGGPTELGNLVSFCDHHHRLSHNGHSAVHTLSTRPASSSRERTVRNWAPALACTVCGRLSSVPPGELLRA